MSAPLTRPSLLQALQEIGEREGRVCYLAGEADVTHAELMAAFGDWSAAIFRHLGLLVDAADTLAAQRPATDEEHAAMWWREDADHDATTADDDNPFATQRAAHAAGIRAGEKRLLPFDDEPVPADKEPTR